MKIVLGPLHHPKQVGSLLGAPDIQIIATPESYPLFARQIQPLYYQPGRTLLQNLWQQLPEHWKPELLIWWHHNSAIPLDIAQCPCFSILVVADSHLYLSNVLDYSSAFDLVAGDQQLIDLLQQMNIPGIFWPAFSYDPDIYFPRSGLSRDLDISFTGSFKYHPHRNSVLYRISQMSSRYRIYIHNHTYGSAYNEILNRSKIVVNFSIRKEMNLRCYEAARCGALLFYEASNLEVPQILPPDQCSVSYNWLNLEDKLHWYLKHPEKRERLAQAGQKRIEHFSYTRQLLWLLEKVQKTLKTPLPPRSWHKRPLWQQAQIQAVNFYLSESATARQTARRVMEQALSHNRRSLLPSSFWSTLAITCVAQPSPDLEKAHQYLNQCPLQDFLTEYNRTWLYLLDKNEEQAMQLALKLLKQPFVLEQEPRPALFSQAHLPLGLNYATLYREELLRKALQEPTGAALRMADFLQWNLGLICGHIYLQQNQYIQASEYLEYVCELLPGVGETDLLLAMSLACQHQLEKAREVLWRGLAHHPLKQAVWYTLYRWSQQDPAQLNVCQNRLQLLKNAIPDWDLEHLV